jgi:hypothetical protein
MHRLVTTFAVAAGSVLVVLVLAGPGGARMAHGTELVKCSTATPPVDSLGKPIDLTGTWINSDKQQYSVRQVGSCLWWSGPNVFFGQVTGSSVIGQWADVRSRLSGTNGSLTLAITSQNTVLLRRISTGTVPIKILRKSV